MKKNINLLRTCFLTMLLLAMVNGFFMDKMAATSPQNPTEIPEAKIKCDANISGRCWVDSVDWYTYDALYTLVCEFSGKQRDYCCLATVKIANYILSTLCLR